MAVIRHDRARRTETPNGVMTTFASPTQGGAGQAIFRAEMAPGNAGPLHALDAPIVWTVLDGGATIILDGAEVVVTVGDTVVIPADMPRKVIADRGEGFTAIGVTPPGTRAYALDGTTVSRDCAVPDGDKVIPAWMV